MNAASSPLRLLLAVMLLAFIAAGCIGPTMEQQSDWHWQQLNPTYRPPHPFDQGWQEPW